MSAEMMVDETQTIVEQKPKPVIGSHLSLNYKEDPNPTGFICGCKYMVFGTLLIHFV